MIIFLPDRSPQLLQFSENLEKKKKNDNFVKKNIDERGLCLGALGKAVLTMMRSSVGNFSIL